MIVDFEKLKQEKQSEIVTAFIVKRDGYDEDLFFLEDEIETCYDGGDAYEEKDRDGEFSSVGESVWVTKHGRWFFPAAHGDRTENIDYPVRNKYTESVFENEEELFDDARNESARFHRYLDGSNNAHICIDDHDVTELELLPLLGDNYADLENLKIYQFRRSNYQADLGHIVEIDLYEDTEITINSAVISCHDVRLQAVRDLANDAISYLGNGETTPESYAIELWNARTKEEALRDFLSYTELSDYISVCDEVWGRV